MTDEIKDPIAELLRLPKCPLCCEEEHCYRCKARYGLQIKNAGLQLELEQLRGLVQVWRAHIADVYALRGREDVYTPNEVFHICHGCGNSAGLIYQGLCDVCRQEIGEIPRKPPLPAFAGTDISLPYKGVQLISDLSLIGKPVTTQPLILPDDYDPEQRRQYMIEYFAYETVGVLLPGLIPGHPAEKEGSDADVGSA